MYVRLVYYKIKICIISHIIKGSYSDSAFVCARSSTIGCGNSFASFTMPKADRLSTVSTASDIVA